MASARALCPPPNLDERIAGDAEFLRSCLIDGGRLYLSLMADTPGIEQYLPLMGKPG